MVKFEYTLDESTKAAIAALQKEATKREGKECVSPLDTVMTDGNVKCTVTVDEKNARLIVSGDEGIFKDMVFALNKATRLLEGSDYLFICSLDKNLIFPAKNDAMTQGTGDELMSLIGNTKGLETSREIKNREREEKELIERKQRKDAVKFFGGNEEPGKKATNSSDLKDRFRIQKYFAIGFAILGMLQSLDGGLFGGGGVSPIAMLISGLIGLVTGFLLSYVYVFFRVWFDQQEEKVKVGSIVLFIITVPTFFIMGILGAIPYSVYTLVDGKRNAGFTKIVKILTPIVAGVVILAELALVSMFFI